MTGVKLIKICIVMPGHWTYKMGGAEYQVKCIIEALKKTNKYEIYFITRNVNPNYSPDGYKIVLIKNLFGFSKGHYLLDFFSLFKALRKIKPDVIYQRRGLPYTGFSILYRQAYGCRFIWHIAHDDDVTPQKPEYYLKGIYQFVEKKVLEFGILRSSEIIAQTKDQVRILESNYRKKATMVINNFHPLPKENISKKGPINIVWVANLKPMKQPEVFLTLAHEFRNRDDVKFTMIGALPNTGWGKDIKEKIIREKNVHYLGLLEQKRVNEIFASAHILVNTSLREGFSNTFIQAWMRMVPVVSLFVNPDNILNRKKVGLFSGNYKKLFTDLGELIENNSLREELGCSAQKYAFENYGEKQAQKLVALIG